MWPGGERHKAMHMDLFALLAAPVMEVKPGTSPFPLVLVPVWCFGDSFAELQCGLEHGPSFMEAATWVSTVRLLCVALHPSACALDSLFVGACSRLVVL